MKEFSLQSQAELETLSKETQEQLLREKESLSSQLRQNQAMIAREQQQINDNNSRLEKRCEEMKAALQESERILNESRRNWQGL